MPRAHSPKRVEAPTTVLIQRATLSAEIWGHTANKPGLAKLLGKASAGGHSPSRTSPCPSPCPGTHVSRVVVPIGGQDQPQEDGDHPAEGILEGPQHQQLKLSPGTARETASTPRSPSPFPGTSLPPQQKQGRKPSPGTGRYPVSPSLVHGDSGQAGAAAAAGPSVDHHGHILQGAEHCLLPPKALHHDQHQEVEADGEVPEEEGSRSGPVGSPVSLPPG